jgi:hypothetical protein
MTEVKQERVGWVERLLSRWLECKTIVNCDRDPYLHRWYLVRRPEFGVFIHKFIRSDEDRALHDHPWNFFVIPVWRGYIEHSEEYPPCPDCDANGVVEVFEGSVHQMTTPCSCCDLKGYITVPVRRRVWPIIGMRFRRAEYRHRVELVAGKPSWSIFIRFKSRRDWGFWPMEGFQQWNKWWQEKCE